MKLDDALTDGVVRLFDAGPAYTRQLNRLVDLDPIKKAGFNVLVDCMWGNGAGWFPALLEEEKRVFRKCITSEIRFSHI